MMKKVEHVIICVEMLRQSIRCSLEKEFTKLLCVSP